MAFNPDEYLASGTSFDPDAYLGVDTSAPQPQAPPEPSFAGAGQAALSGMSTIGQQVASGLTGMALGRDIPQTVAISEMAERAIPDYQMGQEGEDFNQWISNFLSEAYAEKVPDKFKPNIEAFVSSIQKGPEEVFQRGIDTAGRLQEKGLEGLADLTRTGASAAAATTGAIPTILEGIPALKIPSLMGKTAAGAQKAFSPEKREIAKQLERQAGGGDFIPAQGTDVAMQDPWVDGVPPSDDLGLSGYTTTTAPYKLSPSGRVIDNPKHKIAKEAGFSDSLLGLFERGNPATRAKYRAMVNSRERLYELPEQSDKFDPNIIAGESLGDRLEVVKRVNKESGAAIDKYVNKNLAKIELNTIPLMDEVASKWAEKGINLDTNDWSIDYGDLELSSKGKKVINNLLDEMKALKTKPTGRTVHNLKRRIDEDIAYGKQVDGMDAKTQSILKDFRASTKEFLENQFPEYGRANAGYSKSIDVINRIQKAAGKVDLEGEYSMANLGRMSRAIMSQRVSRDEIMTAIKDLDNLSAEYGHKFNDDLRGQVHFANQLDDIWGPSRATSFAGQSKQGMGGAAADVMGGGVQGGAAVGKKAMDLLRKKELDDKKKFKAMRELLK